MRNLISETSERISSKSYLKWILISLCMVVLCCAVLAFSGIFGGFAFRNTASADGESVVSETDNAVASLPTVVSTAAGASGANDGLTYNGKMQSAIVYDTTAARFVSLNWTDLSGVTLGVTEGQTAEWVSQSGAIDPLGTTTPGISVIHAGTYTASFALKDGYTQWSDGTTGIKTISFKVNRLVLDLNLNVNGAIGTPNTGYRILYDGLAHGIDATVPSSQALPGMNTQLSVKYLPAGGTEWSTSKPVTAGNYTVRVNLVQENNDYTATNEYQFEIIKRTVSIKWVAAGLVNTETNNMHFIYNGMVHRLAAEPIGAAAADATSDKLAISVRLAMGGASSKYEYVDDTLRPVNVGEYSAFAELTGSARDNYVLLDGSGTEVERAHQVFKITPREVSVIWAKNPETSTYVWVYSGLADKTTFVPTLEKQSGSSTGDTGVVTGETITLTVNYATVVSGTAGAYDTNARVNVGNYRARATQTDSNYVLVNNFLDFEIIKCEVAVEWSGDDKSGADGEIIVWRYDSANHAPSASATAPTAGTDLTSYLQVTGSESEVTSLSSFVSRGFYEAVASFSATVPDSIKNNYSLVNTTRKFRIDKAFVTGVSWFDSEGVEITASPSYTWGEVTGAGPGFTAEATAKVVTADGEKEVIFVLSVSYPGANYQDGESWPVNTGAGYTVLAVLSGQSKDGSENAERFELKISDGGEIKVCDSMKFFITKAEGELNEITVTWVVFTDDTNYIELAALNTAGGAVLGTDGYVSVVNGKFTFVYNGKPQSPTAIYKYAATESQPAGYEILPLGDDSKKTAAGNYTAYLKPSSVYNYKSGTAECAFTVAPLTVKLDWGELTYEYNGKSHKPEPKVDTDYVSTQPEWYKTIVNGMIASGALANIATTGATNAGEYEIKPQLSGNFAFADGTGTATLVITPYQILASSVEWKFDSAAKNDTTEQDKDSWYWNYDGNEHAPVPSLTITADGTNKVTLKLKSVGSASAQGEYYTFAWLDPEEPLNRNYILVLELNKENPVETQARCKFAIAPMEIHTIYWTGEVVAADEEYDGDTIEIDGVTYKVSINGAAVFEHVFDGSVWAPKAYYKLGENYEAFTVEGGERNVGTYYAQIVGDYKLKDASGNELSRKCGYRITPKAVEVIWQQSDDGKILTFEYTGVKQHPEVKDFTGGIDGEEITYEVSGYADAGTYRAEIRFTNANYTYVEGTNSCDFKITAKIITVGWTYTGNAGMNDDVPYWKYNSKAPAISVSEINGVTGTTLTMTDFGEISFTFEYIGLSSGVGSRSVKAVIKSATLNGTAISKDNFKIAEEGNEQKYEITVFELVIKWTGNTENEGKFEWTYDGNPHHPTAEYLSWDGEWYAAEVSGERTVSGTYTAVVQMPAGLSGNCVFADAKDTEHGFVINKAKITVKWTFDGAVYNNETGEYELVYDGKMHAPKAFIDGTETELSVTGQVAHAGKGYIASAALHDAANYEFADKENSFCYFTIKIKTVKVRWVDESPEDTDPFSWYYSPNVERAPKAVVINEDGTDFLVDGELVYALVSGGATHAGKGYVATAEIASSDYAFPADEVFTQLFNILQTELSESEFWWTDADKLKEGWYEYIFNGQSQHPIAQTSNFTAFSYNFTAVDDGKEPVGSALDGITDAGTYKITIEIVNNSDYCIPAGKETVYVRISPKTVTVEWSEASLVYNGENQKPSAYYTDLNGTRYLLTVNVTEEEYKNAGTKYHATAEFILADDIKNYVLDSKSKTKEYEISRRAIPVKWGKNEFNYDGKGHYVTSNIDLSSVIISDFIDLSSGEPIMGIAYVIKDKDGNIIRDEGGNAVLSVIAAGEYTIVLSLTGPEDKTKNYEFKDDDGDSEQAFTITRIALVVTALDVTISYGSEIPVFKVTYSDSTVTENEGDIEGLVVEGRRPWVKTEYEVGSLPSDTGYEIWIDVDMLSKLLPNYNIEGVSAKLYVTATENTVIWFGDPVVGHPNFEYDGEEHRPRAYLYNSTDELEVRYVDKDHNELTDFHAIQAGTYYAKAIAKPGTEIIGEFVTYEIKPREITINIRFVQITYGDRTVNSAGSDIYTDAELDSLWEYANDKRLLNGDELKVYFTWNVKDSIRNDYLNAGEYFIEGHAIASNNYKIVFVGLGNEEAEEQDRQYGLYVVNKADIIDESKPNDYEWFTSEYLLSNGGKYIIGIASEGENGKKYKYLRFAGDQTLEAKFSYSDVYPADGENIPEPDENADYPHTDVNEIAITESGTYIINYRIEIDNHNVLYGRWIVTIGHGDDSIIIIFVKTFIIEYGDEVPENLAKTLVDGGYVGVSGAITNMEYFKSVATASVPTGYNKYADNRTDAGKYDIHFSIADSAPESGLSIIYKQSGQTENTNEGAYTVAPRRIYIEWGQTEFRQDGKMHKPQPILSNFITAEDFTLKGFADGKVYEVTDAGVTLTFTVATTGDFKSNGGHKAAIWVDNGNYRIELIDAVQVISIDAGFPWWLVAVAAAVIVALIILFIILYKRKKGTSIMGGDEDGFYDEYVPEENEE